MGKVKNCKKSEGMCPVIKELVDILQVRPDGIVKKVKAILEELEADKSFIEEAVRFRG